MDHFTAIYQLSDTYSIKLLCDIAGVSRSGYYKWLKRQDQPPTIKEMEEQRLISLIREGFNKVRGIYGYPRMKIWLKRNYELKINKKRIYRLMKLMGIKSIIRKKKPKFSGKADGVFANNVLNRKFHARLPNLKYVTDITYLTFGRHRLYLSVILDLFNNEVVSYKISESNDTELVLNTVKETQEKRDVSQVLIHSDQGHQYTSHKYNNYIKELNMKVSMSRKANCWDNACIESFFGHLKSELMYINNFRTKELVIKAVQGYIHFYNTERFQKKLNNLTPLEYRNKVVA